MFLNVLPKLLVVLSELVWDGYILCWQFYLNWKLMATCHSRSDGKIWNEIFVWSSLLFMQKYKAMQMLIYFVPFPLQLPFAKILLRKRFVPHSKNFSSGALLLDSSWILECVHASQWQCMCKDSRAPVSHPSAHSFILWYWFIHHINSRHKYRAHTSAIWSFKDQ